MGNDSNKIAKLKLKNILVYYYNIVIGRQHLQNLQRHTFSQYELAYCDYV